MGCFLTCFGGSKNRKTGKKSNRSLPLYSEINSSLYPSLFPKEINSRITVATHEPVSELRYFPCLSPKEINSPIAIATHEPVSELRKEEKATAIVRKKVSFDLNVTTFENAAVDEEPKDIESTKTEIQLKQENNGAEKYGKDAPKPTAFQPNYRYQNCESSDDDDNDDDDDDSDKEEEEDYEKCDFSEEENEIAINENEEDSYDSLFSLPMENERKILQEESRPNASADSAVAIEPSILAKSNVRDRSQYINAVLNPVENLSQWKKVKVHAATSKNRNKENINSEMEDKTFVSPEPTFKIQKPQKSISPSLNASGVANQEITLDTSLSNWLVPRNDPRLREREKTNSTLSNSSSLREELPILGALTVEDIKQSSQTSSPRSFSSRSREEIPIMGTVGSYWNSKCKQDSASSWSSGSDTRGIPNTTNKYREDQKVNWHSTPFETRLKRALKEVTETCTNVEFEV